MSGEHFALPALEESGRPVRAHCGLTADLERARKQSLVECQMPGANNFEKAVRATLKAALATC